MKSERRHQNESASEPTGELGQYGTRDVSTLLGVSRFKVRTLAKLIFPEKPRGRRREFRFSFQDLVFIRAAGAVHEKGISYAAIGECLRRMRTQVAAGVSIDSAQIWADGKEITVRLGSEAWHPRTGQLLFSFDAERRNEAVPFRRPVRD